MQEYKKILGWWVAIFMDDVNSQQPLVLTQCGTEVTRGYTEAQVEESLHFQKTG